MYRRSTRIPAPLIRLTVLMLLTGCGATSTRLPVGAATGSTSSASTALAPQGPQLGYLWDANEKNLYPVPGTPGGAHFGAPLLGSDSKYIAGAVSGSAGSKEWALLLDSTGTLDVLTLPSVTPSVVATRVALDAAIVFAPGGGYAGVFSASTNTLLLVSGLPAQPLVSTLAVPAGGALTGVAVSDQGTVLAGWPGTGGIAVGVVSAGGSTVIASVSKWGGAAFTPGSAAGQEQAVVADGGTGQLTRVTGIGGAAASATQLSSGGKLQTPVAVAISGDGLWAFAADGAKQQVVRFDLSGSMPPLAIACACQPSRLVALPGNMLFEVSTDRAAQPAWLLDGHAVVSRTFFVPALASSTGSTRAVNATAVAAKATTGGGR